MTKRRKKARCIGFTVIDMAEALPTRYDWLRAEGKIEPIDFLEGGEAA